MSDDTVPQFGDALREAPGRAGAAEGALATHCPTCGAHFSPDGRFCPFDGTPLVGAAGWHPSADALLGAVVDGRYELVGVLGEGGMGTVYEARHRALGKRFALKALRKDLAQDPEIAARFIQEARTAAAVSHPGLVEITDFGRMESGQVYFVMELLAGRSLASLLRAGGPLPPARGLAIVRQLALAVKAAHDASIVHRDLKPDNILVSRGDDGADLVKVVDFGLAKVIGSSKLTRAGMVFGTPHYMSPEQAAAEVVDHRADIYALGVIMYEMFTGQVPFEADSFMGVLSKHLYMTPVPPSSLRPDIRALGALEAVILRCLQKRPEARYANLADLLADLDQQLLRRTTAVGDAPGLSATAPGLWRGAPGRLRAGPVLGIALAFVLGVALVLVAKQRGARSAAPPLGAAVATPGPNRAAPREEALEKPVSAPSPSEPSTSPSPPPSAPARKPAARARASGSPTSSPKSPPSAKRPVGTGDIVDPWAR